MYQSRTHKWDLNKSLKLLALSVQMSLKIQESSLMKFHFAKHVIPLVESSVHLQLDQKKEFQVQSQQHRILLKTKFALLNAPTHDPQQLYMERINFCLKSVFLLNNLQCILFPLCFASNRSFTCCTSLSPRPDNEIKIISFFVHFLASFIA